MYHPQGNRVAGHEVGEVDGTSGASRGAVSGKAYVGEGKPSLWRPVLGLK